MRFCYFFSTCDLLFSQNMRLFFIAHAILPLSKKSHVGSGWGIWSIHQPTSDRKTGYSVLVTGAAGFVRTHISAILKRHDDCVLGLDNFNNYYDPTLEGLVKFCWKKVGFLLWKGT
ncbi:putative UDP-glucuronate 4-epimerase [Helianthus anomalus]